MSLSLLIIIENPVLLHLFHEIVHTFVTQLLFEVCIPQSLAALLV